MGRFSWEKRKRLNDSTTNVEEKSALITLQHYSLKKTMQCKNT